LSQLVREPDVALRDALIAYTRFYRRLLPCRDRMVVADFGEVTTDFGAVTRRINDRFGTAFAEFEPTERNTNRCFELIKLRGTLSPVLLGFESGTVTAEDLLPEIALLTRHSQEQAGAGTAAWVPSGDRDRSKAALQEQWERPGLALLRERAQWIYQAFRRAQ
jgi:hypothetical protein